MATSLIQSAFNCNGTTGVTLPGLVTVGDLLIVGRDCKNNTTTSDPGTTLGGAAAWTTIFAQLDTAGAGNHHVSCYAKIANGTGQTMVNTTNGAGGAIWQVRGVTLAQLIAISKTLGTGNVLDLGGLGSGGGGVAMMYISQNCADTASMTFTPDAGWSVDCSFLTPTFSSARPLWQGHGLTTGAALEAKLTSSIAGLGWAGFAILAPGPSALPHGHSGGKSTAPLEPAGLGVVSQAVNRGNY